MCITVILYQVVPRHLILQRVLLFKKQNIQYEISHERVGFLADRIYMPTPRIQGQTLPSYAQLIRLLPPGKINPVKQGITIRKNRQPVRIGQSSNSRVNRTDSAHSINTRSASNMIPCFPANNSTDMHHYDIVSSRSSPSHFTNDTPLNISKVRTRSTTKKLNHCLENQIGYNLRNRNTGNCSCCNSSQED